MVSLFENIFMKFSNNFLTVKFFYHTNVEASVFCNFFKFRVFVVTPIFKFKVSTGINIKRVPFRCSIKCIVVFISFIYLYTFFEIKVIYIKFLFTSNFNIFSAIANVSSLCIEYHSISLTCNYSFLTWCKINCFLLIAFAWSSIRSI